MIRIGQLVEVFQKPLTREDYEGTAQVVEVLDRDEADSTTTARVRFIGDDQSDTVIRRISESSS